MTKAVRLVLDACRDAANEIVNGAQGESWLRRYIGRLALLRAVGHVLVRRRAS